MSVYNHINEWYDHRPNGTPLSPTTSSTANERTSHHSIALSTYVHYSIPAVPILPGISSTECPGRRAFDSFLRSGGRALVYHGPKWILSDILAGMDRFAFPGWFNALWDRQGANKCRQERVCVGSDVLRWITTRKLSPNPRMEDIFVLRCTGLSGMCNIQRWVVTEAYCARSMQPVHDLSWLMH